MVLVRNVVDCGNHDNISDGNITYNDDSTTYQSTATYWCNDGYELIGSSEVVCNASGLWNDTAYCKIKGKDHHH